MYTTIADFIAEWTHEAASTQKVLDALTDASLSQAVTPNDRTLGRIAWHIVASTPHMLSEFGLQVDELGLSEGTQPKSAAEIAEAFRRVNAATVKAVQQWSDASLKDMQPVFGMQMPKAMTLSLLNKHIIHHRGQLTVLMRQAGLSVPGVYGPSRDEWVAMGATPMQ